MTPDPNQDGHQIDAARLIAKLEQSILNLTRGTAMMEIYIEDLTAERDALAEALSQSKSADPVPKEAV